MIVPTPVPGRRRRAARAGCGTSHDGRRARPRKLGAGPVHTLAPPLKERPVIIFFEILLVLVAVGVLAFAGLTVKKLFQGQR
ncbi:hypothetical protein SUDANB60_02937 [Streptomyces sp. enrichment culture]